MEPGPAGGFRYEPIKILPVFQNLVGATMINQHETMNDRFEQGRLTPTDLTRLAEANARAQRTMAPSEKVALSRQGYPSIVLTVAELHRGNRYVTEQFEAARDRERAQQDAVTMARAGRS